MEDSKYENVIAKYSDRQLLIEEMIVEEEKTTIYAKEKAIREERKRRCRQQ